MMTDNTSADYVKELMKERDAIDPSLTNVIRQIDQEIERLQSGGPVNENGHNKSDKTLELVEVTKPKPIKLRIKVAVPVKEHPNFNFVGKLLGPKGLSLKRLQEETMTKMAILGKGSMRDKDKEAELRDGPDPKYHHLNDELHVDISVYAPAADAYERMANAIEGVKKFLVPDYFDEIRTQQFQELAIMNGGRSRGGGSSRPPLKGGPAGSRPPRPSNQGGQSQWVSLAATPPQRTSGRGGNRGGRGQPPSQFNRGQGRGGMRGRGNAMGGGGRPVPSEEYGNDMSYNFGEEQGYDDGYDQIPPNSSNDNSFYDYNGPNESSYPEGGQADYQQTDYTDWNPPESGSRMKSEQGGGPIRRGGMSRGGFRSQPYGGQSFGNRY